MKNKASKQKKIWYIEKVRHQNIVLVLGSIIFAIYYVEYKATEERLWILLELGGVLIAAYMVAVLLTLYVLFPLAYFLVDIKKEKTEYSLNMKNGSVLISYVTIALAFLLTHYI